MNKFMDKYEGKLNEGTEELEEAVLEINLRPMPMVRLLVPRQKVSMLISGGKVKNKVYSWLSKQ